MLRVKDFDLEPGETYPTTAKHGAGRVLKLKKATLAMLKQYITDNNLTPTDTLWKSKRVMQNWGRLKVSIAKKLRISFK